MTEYNITHINETDSTNDEIKRFAVKGYSHGTVVWAERQTKGRGRLGKSWSSGEGGLFFSVLLRPSTERTVVPGMITLSAGIAVAEAVREHGIEVGLKWPNDVIVNGKKACGILAEASFNDGVAESVVLGIGVNVNIKDFPDELREIATSMYLETGRITDRRLVLSSILKIFGSLYDEASWDENAQVIGRYKELCLNIGKPVILTKAVTGERVEGVGADIDANGGLIIRLADGSAPHITVAHQFRRILKSRTERHPHPYAACFCHLTRGPRNPGGEPYTAPVCRLRA